MKTNKQKKQPKRQTEEIMTQKTDVPATSPDVSEPDNILESFLGSPGKLYDYLIKILIAFLILSIIMLIVIEKQ